MLGRSLGQRGGSWTAEKNARLLRKIDTDGDGSVSQSEFVAYFSEGLPRDPTEFDSIIEQFLEVARSCHLEAKVPEVESSSRAQVVSRAQVASAEWRSSLIVVLCSWALMSRSAQSWRQS